MLTVIQDKLVINPLLTFVVVGIIPPFSTTVQQSASLRLHKNAPVWYSCFFHDNCWISGLIQNSKFRFTCTSTNDVSFSIRSFISCHDDLHGFYGVFIKGPDVKPYWELFMCWAYYLHINTFKFLDRINSYNLIILEGWKDHFLLSTCMVSICFFIKFGQKHTLLLF